jgi:phosphatidylglycerophosphate synthase
MLDRSALALLQPWLQRLAQAMARQGWQADTLTWLGFALGLAAAGLVGFGQTHWALLPLLASRLCDGLDGTLARLTRPSDRGAFLDIALDMLFYASIPLAFAIAQPASNALPAAVLLAAFIGTSSSFFAYAVLAEKRGLKNLTLPNKGFFFLGGLTEGTETIVCFVLMCLWPQHFALWAYGFAALCAVTTATRLWAGMRQLK